MDKVSRTFFEQKDIIKHNESQQNWLLSAKQGDKVGELSGTFGNFRDWATSYQVWAIISP
jgi:hypothetical protein